MGGGTPSWTGVHERDRWPVPEMSPPIRVVLEEVVAACLWRGGGNVSGNHVDPELGEQDLQAVSGEDFS